jgi:hypothetical protein
MAIRTALWPGPEVRVRSCPEVMAIIFPTILGDRSQT